MRLRLENSGNTKTLYRPSTGVVYFVNDCNIPLASKAKRKAKRAIKETEQVKRVQAKQTKKTAKKEGQAARKVSVQARKTTRVDNKGQRKGAKQQKKVVKKQVGVAKQDKRLIRVQGKTDILQARQAAQLDKIQNPQNYVEPEEQEAEYGEEVYEDPQQEYSEYELMPEEEYQEEEELQDGIFGTALQFIKAGAKDVIGKGKAAVKNLPNSAKSKIQTTVAASAENKRLKEANETLKSDLSKAKMNQIIFGASGTAAGFALGYLIAKK